MAYLLHVDTNYIWVVPNLDHPLHALEDARSHSFLFGTTSGLNTKSTSSTFPILPSTLSSSWDAPAIDSSLFTSSAFSESCSDVSQDIYGPIRKTDLFDHRNHMIVIIRSTASIYVCHRETGRVISDTTNDLSASPQKTKSATPSPPPYLLSLPSTSSVLTYIDGLVGLIMLTRGAHLVYITKSSSCATILGREIFLAESFGTVPLPPGKALSDLNYSPRLVAEEELTLESFLKVLTSTPLYFSRSYELTLTLQRAQELSQAAQETDTISSQTSTSTSPWTLTPTSTSTFSNSTVGLDYVTYTSEVLHRAQEEYFFNRSVFATLCHAEACTMFYHRKLYPTLLDKNQATLGLNQNINAGKTNQNTTNSSDLHSVHSRTRPPPRAPVPSAAAPSPVASFATLLVAGFAGEALIPFDLLDDSVQSGVDNLVGGEKIPVLNQEKKVIPGQTLRNRRQNHYENDSETENVIENGTDTEAETSEVETEGDTDGENNEENEEKTHVPQYIVLNTLLRIERHRFGLRLSSRGIDDAGFCGITSCSEVIVQSLDTVGRPLSVGSFSSLRGSPPVFFDQNPSANPFRQPDVVFPMIRSRTRSGEKVGGDEGSNSDAVANAQATPTHTAASTVKDTWSSSVACSLHFARALAQTITPRTMYSLLSRRREIGVNDKNGVHVPEQPLLRVISLLSSGVTHENRINLRLARGVDAFNTILTDFSPPSPTLLEVAGGSPGAYIRAVALQQIDSRIAHYRISNALAAVVMKGESKLPLTKTTDLEKPSETQRDAQLVPPSYQYLFDKMEEENLTLMPSSSVPDPFVEFVHLNLNSMRTVDSTKIIHSYARNCGVFFVDKLLSPHPTVLSKQTQFLRVNCFDSLDRTNKVIRRASEHVINVIFNQMMLNSVDGNGVTPTLARGLTCPLSPSMSTSSLSMPGSLMYASYTLLNSTGDVASYVSTDTRCVFPDICPPQASTQKPWVVESVTSPLQDFTYHRHQWVQGNINHHALGENEEMRETNVLGRKMLLNNFPNKVFFGDEIPPGLSQPSYAPVTADVSITSPPPAILSASSAVSSSRCVHPNGKNGSSGHGKLIRQSSLTPIVTPSVSPLETPLDSPVVSSCAHVSADALDSPCGSAVSPSADLELSPVSSTSKNPLPCSVRPFSRRAFSSRFYHLVQRRFADILRTGPMQDSIAVFMTLYKPQRQNLPFQGLHIVSENELEAKSGKSTASQASSSGNNAPRYVLTFMPKSIHTQSSFPLIRVLLTSFSLVVLWLILGMLVLPRFEIPFSYFLHPLIASWIFGLSPSPRNPLYLFESLSLALKSGAYDSQRYEEYGWVIDFTQMSYFRVIPFLLLVFIASTILQFYLFRDLLINYPKISPSLYTPCFDFDLLKPNPVSLAASSPAQETPRRQAKK